MNTPIPRYSRPHKLLDLDALAKSTRDLAVRVDEHAEAERIAIRRPVPVRELAGVIKTNNERRSQAITLTADLANARRELLTLSELLEHDADAVIRDAQARGESVPFHTSAALYFTASREFFKALSADEPTQTRAEAQRATRALTSEVIATIDRITGRR